MKKATLETIRTALLDAGYESTDPVMVEIETELNKGAEAKAASEAVYNEAKPTIMAILDKLTAPAPLAEIYAEAEAALPEGFTKGKLQYAMTRLWVDEIVKIEGKPNCYKKA